MESVTMGSITKTEEAPGAILSVTPAGDFNPPLAPFRERLSWALYDFANTVFSMNIATLYFSVWLVEDLGHSNTLYATAYSSVPDLLRATRKSRAWQCSWKTPYSRNHRVPS